MHRTSLLFPLLAATLLLPSIAHAQGAAAEALFNSGRDAMAQGDFARACQQLRESDRLEPAVGTEFNLADCEEKRGHLATAWQLFRAVQQKLPEGDGRVAIAAARAQALDGRVPKLTLRLAPGAPAETTVRDGAVELGSASFGVALPMDPGAHDLLVSAEGRESRTFHVELAEGDATALDMGPGAAMTAAPVVVPVPTPRAPADTASVPSHGSSPRTLGFVIGGVGVAGLGAGAIAGAMVLGKKSTVDAECTAQKACSQAGLDAAQSGHTLQTVSNIGWVVGAIGVGVGAYFVLTSGSGKASTTVGAAPTPAGGQLSVARSW